MIKSGTIRLPFDDTMTGLHGTWDLEAGTGPRSYVSPDIPFDPPLPRFGSPPHVVVSLTGFEATAGPPSIELFVETVQAEEFNIHVRVSGNCTLSWVWVTWVANDNL